MPLEQKIIGCIMGGAVGDALGAPLEFLTLEQIGKQWGTVDRYVEFKDGSGSITDDTQMLLFTVEGLVQARERGRIKGQCHIPGVVFWAYQRWLITQNETPSSASAPELKLGTLIHQREMFHRRAPGMACLSGLKYPDRKGVNLKSKGCGTVMRIAPAGFFYDDAQFTFEIGCDLSRLTHGHPTGVLAGGALALLIYELYHQTPLPEAIARVLRELEQHSGHEEVSVAIQKASRLANSTAAPETAIAELGEGWVAEETLAIALYCALKFQTDFRAGVTAAINITGDSDSTGAVSGNILGCMLGKSAIPPEWIANLREHSIVSNMANAISVAI